MKRALLIAGGTVGGLGAVLSVTPPQLGDNGLSTLSGASAATSLPESKPAAANATKSAPSASASATPTKKATIAKKSATTQKSAVTQKSTTNSNSATTNSSTTTTDNNAAAPAAPAGVNGTFTGDAFNASYGNVQVKITVVNGKITDAVAVQSPTGRSQRYSDYAVPNLRQQTLTAQSAAIRGVGGASYTSYGWYKSLISALQKAGMATGV